MTLKIGTTRPAGTTDPHENGRPARGRMRQAAATDVRRIHLPEGFLSGHAEEQIAD